MSSSRCIYIANRAPEERARLYCEFASKDVEAGAPSRRTIGRTSSSPSGARTAPGIRKSTAAGSRPRGNQGLVVCTLGFLVITLGALTPRAWPISNGDLGPTKITNVAGFGTFPYGPDWTISLPVLLIIPAIESTALSSGPRTNIPVAGGPLEFHIPHWSIGFISASCVMDFRTKQMPYSSLSALYEASTTVCPLNCLSCSVRVLMFSTCRAEIKNCVCAKPASISSARLATASTFSWALPAASFAVLESVSASPATVLALPALSSARADLSNADCALVSAARALSLREPISIPEILLVLTRHISSSARADMSRSVERFASRSCLSLGPPVQQSVNSARYSPVQPKATSAQEAYSAHSQCSNDVARDETSDAVKIILTHQNENDEFKGTTTPRHYPSPLS